MNLYLDGVQDEVRAEAKLQLVYTRRSRIALEFAPSHFPRPQASVSKGDRTCRLFIVGEHQQPPSEFGLTVQIWTVPAAARDYAESTPEEPCRLQVSGVLVSTKALLQIGSPSGGPVNEYRVQNANLELRTLDATGCPSLLCGRWRVLTAGELMLHVSLNTLVAQWLMKRLHVDENYRRLLIGTNLKSPQLHGLAGYVSDPALTETQYEQQTKTSIADVGRWTRWAGSVVIWVAIVLFLILTPVAVSQASSAGPGTQGGIPDLKSIVQSLEKTQLRNLATTRAYTVVRQYKLYHGDDKEPMSVVTAEISLVPPSSKTYEVKQVSGNARGEQIVRQILTLEATPASGDTSSEINRRNYDFAWLQQENLGTDPAYVVRIIAKRKQRNLLNGQMWVETKTFRILRIEGVPSKKVSWWIKTLHITMQYGELKEMWMATAMQATAVVRLAGSYVLVGKDITVQPTVVVAEKH